MERAGTLLTTAAVAGLLLVASAAPAAAATEPSFIVALSADGSAELSVTSTFDLESDEEQAAFDELRNNESVREAYTQRFRDRWQDLANATAESTGREMAVEDVALELTRDGSTGVATVTATWSGLAATDDGRLTLTEPFASDYVADRPVTIVLPEGYEVASAEPEPSSADGNAITYDAGTEFDGFELVAEQSTDDGAESATDSGGSTGGNGPGFGVAAALAALAAAVLFARSRE